MPDGRVPGGGLPSGEGIPVRPPSKVVKEPSPDVLTQQAAQEQAARKIESANAATRALQVSGGEIDTEGKAEISDVNAALDSITQGQPKADEVPLVVPQPQSQQQESVSVPDEASQILQEASDSGKPPETPHKTQGTSGENFLGAVPPAAPEKLVAEIKAQARNDFMRAEMQADSDLREILQAAGIDTTTLDIDQAMQDLQPRAEKDNADVKDVQAYRRLLELQGRGVYNEALQELQELKAKGTDITQGEGKQSYEATQEKIRQGQIFERSKHNREEIVREMGKDPTFAESMKSVGFDPEVRNIDEMISYLEQKYPFGTHVPPEHEKLFNTLRQIRNGVSRKEAQSEAARATTPEEKRIALEKEVSASAEDQKTLLEKFSEKGAKLAKNLGWKNGKELFDLGRQTLGYRDVMRRYRQELRNAPLGGKEDAQKNFDMAKKLWRESRRKLIGANLIRAFILWFFLIGPAALTILPFLGSAQLMKMLGKSQ